MCSPVVAGSPQIQHLMAMGRAGRWKAGNPASTLPDVIESSPLNYIPVKMNRGFELPLPRRRTAALCRIGGLQRVELRLSAYGQLAVKKDERVFPPQQSPITLLVG
jgi:hypothetical protein